MKEIFCQHYLVTLLYSMRLLVRSCWTSEGVSNGQNAVSGTPVYGTRRAGSGGVWPRAECGRRVASTRLDVQSVNMDRISQ
jgi:hypothetical protein